MIGWLILAAVLALCAVLCIRAARFKPEAGAGAAPTPVAVDTEGAVQRLAQLVRIPTVSNYDAEKFDETQFEAAGIVPPRTCDVPARAHRPHGHAVSLERKKQRRSRCPDGAL